MDAMVGHWKLVACLSRKHPVGSIRVGRPSTRRYRQKFGNTGKPVSMNQELLFRLKAARQGLPPHAVWLEQMTGKAAYPTAYKPHGWVA